MDNLILEVPAYIKKVETMADRGYKLTVYTQEMTPQNGAVLLQLKDLSGHMLFKVAPFTEEEAKSIPDYTPEFRGEKSPSQRLRGVIYRVWEQRGKHGDFEVFYRSQMERIIEKYKEVLT